MGEVKQGQDIEFSIVSTTCACMLTLFRVDPFAGVVHHFASGGANEVGPSSEMDHL